MTEEQLNQLNQFRIPIFDFKNPEIVALLHDLFPEDRIYTTFGVYPNTPIGDYKIKVSDYSAYNAACNGVPKENLVGHIVYNMMYRPGRAFFVDGVCFNSGGLDMSQIQAHIPHIKQYVKTKDNRPYW